MADSESGTLQANTTKTVLLTSGAGTVEVINVDGAAVIAVTVDGGEPSTSGGVGVVLLPAVVCEKRLQSRGSSVVKLKSAGTPIFSVNAAL